MASLHQTARSRYFFRMKRYSMHAAECDSQPLLQSSEAFDDTIGHDIKHQVREVCHCICKAFNVTAIGCYLHITNAMLCKVRMSYTLLTCRWTCTSYFPRSALCITQKVSMVSQHIVGLTVIRLSHDRHDGTVTLSIMK